jgi:aminopeptidase N
MTGGLRRRGPLVALLAVVVVLLAATTVFVVRHGRSKPPDRATTAGTGSPAPTGDPQASPDTPAAGALGAGDRLFPRLGNGGYQVEHYDLDLHYPTADPTKPLTGSVTATAVTSRALSSFALDFAGASVGSVVVDSAPGTFRRDGEDLVVTPRTPLPRGKRFAVTVEDFVSVTPSAADNLGSGLLATRDGTVWMGQPNMAHRVFPSNDHPSDLATFSFRIDVPAGITAVANGVSGGSTTARGRTVWRYEQAEPMATELAQVACGRFTVTTRATSGGIVVRDVTPTRLTRELAPQLADELQHLDWMRAKVGDYPFKVFGSLVADATFGFGGLETQTLILYPLSALRSPTPQGRGEVMVHELAHQWFGNSVAPATWSDLWLNEGHATWYQALWSTESQGGEPALAETMRQAYGNLAGWLRDSGPVAAPRGGDARLFSPTVYRGGALALYALRQKIGVPAFERLEREWVSTYRGSSAGTQDFITLASRVADQDVGPFLRGWLHAETPLPMPGHADWTSQPSPT